MTDTLLKQIADMAAEDLRAQVSDGETDILEAIHKAEEESSLQETPLKFNIGFKIQIDFEKREINNQLSWSVKQSLATSHALGDPNQPNLPGADETTVTVVAGEKSVTVPFNTFKKAARKIAKGKV